MVEIYDKAGLKHIKLANNDIELIFLPQIGAKMISIKSKITENEFLLPNQLDEKKYIIPKYGDDFARSDASGFDECFPNIEISKINFKENEIILPDHGELWNQQWHYQIDHDNIIFTLNGIALDYVFKKSISLKGNIIVINYTLENKSDVDFNYIWSAHPLLTVSEGDGIIYSGADKEFLINWVSESKYGRKGEFVKWPFLNDLDLSVINTKELGMAVKLFSKRLDSGYAALIKKKENEAIVFHIDSADIPYFGLWYCFGGWPVDQEYKHYTFAIEPTNSPNDSLTDAINKNEAMFIKNGVTKHWSFEISLVSDIHLLLGEKISLNQIDSSK